MCKPAGVRCHSDWRPAMTGSLGYRSATQLRAAFAAGAMAPADVVAELLDRAGGMDTASSGVTGLDPGGAHAAAVDSARRYRSGSARALEGIPVVVKDLSLLHGVIAQPAPTRAGRAPLTFGILASHLPVELAPAVTAALEEMAAALSGAGHRGTALSGTGLADAYDTLGDVVLTEGIAVHRTAGLWPHRADDYLPGVRSRLQRADNTDGVAAACARRRRARIAVAAERILRHVDVVVSPASAVAAAAIGHDRDPFAPEAVAFRAGVIACCAWQSLTGLPTCVVRVRFDPNGLPIGLQFTARRGADGVALEAAALTVRLTADIQDQWPSPGVREQLP